MREFVEGGVSCWELVEGVYYVPGAPGPQVRVGPWDEVREYPEDANIPRYVDGAVWDDGERVLSGLSLPALRMARAATAEAEQVVQLLTQKSTEYGCAAWNPLPVFEDVAWETQLNARMNEKVSRLKAQTAGGHNAEDTELDLLACLLLKRAIRRLKST